MPLAVTSLAGAVVGVLAESDAKNNRTSWDKQWSTYAKGAMALLGLGMAATGKGSADVAEPLLHGAGFSLASDAGRVLAGKVSAGGPVPYFTQGSYPTPQPSRIARESAFAAAQSASSIRREPAGLAA